MFVEFKKSTKGLKRYVKWTPGQIMPFFNMYYEREGRKYPDIKQIKSDFWIPEGQGVKSYTYLNTYPAVWDSAIWLTYGHFSQDLDNKLPRDSSFLHDIIGLYIYTRQECVTFSESLDKFSEFSPRLLERLQRWLFPSTATDDELVQFAESLLSPNITLPDLKNLIKRRRG